MSSDGINTYTDLGVTKIRAAAGSASQVKIKYISIGDGDGSTYTPHPSQNALRRERGRTEIERHYSYGSNAWRVTASFPPETPTSTVREMGFHDEDGDLIALWAGPDIETRQVGVWEYLIEHSIAFQGLQEGIVIIDAPEDALIDFMAVTLRSLASTRIEQFNQAERLTVLEG